MQCGADALRGGPAAVMREINASISVDKRLWREDIAASRAHAAMLEQQGILSAEDAQAIDTGLLQIAVEIEAGELEEDPALEDIHMHVEHRLSQLIGDAAGRLHTARSRNDQVATDFKLFVRRSIDEAILGIEALEMRADRPGRGTCGQRHARLHPPPVGPAGDARPPSDGLSRNAGPRPQPLRRRAQADE